jgi:hypothetical protein
VDDANVVPDRDLGGAADHDPMFGAMHVALQRQLASRRDEAAAVAALKELAAGTLNRRSA